MIKKEKINHILDLAKRSDLSSADYTALIEALRKEERLPTASPHSLPGIFSLLGGAVITLGLVILVLMFWRSISSVGHLFLTLGISVTLGVSGVLFMRQKLSIFSDALLFISSALFPFGLWILFRDFLQFDFFAQGSILMPLLFLLSFAFSHLIFTLGGRAFQLIFSILYGTLLYWSIVNRIFNLSSLPTLFLSDISLLLAMVNGASFLALSRFLKKVGYSASSTILVLIGSIVFYASFLAYTGFDYSAKILMEFLYPIIVFLGIYLSTLWQSRVLLATSSLFLMIDIIKITHEYFDIEFLPWPLLVIFWGIILVITGELFRRLSKKYFLK
ncbi:MAG: hypothetical protein FJY91_02735 [Candidatus Harrisonbacteria bacterium]|nr:hypothetical protein [Candidatus Harrisonbacteria bacterium]